MVYGFDEHKCRVEVCSIDAFGRADGPAIKFPNGKRLSHFYYNADDSIPAGDSITFRINGFQESAEIKCVVANPCVLPGDSVKVSASVYIGMNENMEKTVAITITNNGTAPANHVGYSAIVVWSE